MRPAVRAAKPPGRKTLPPIKRPDEAKTVLKMRRWVEQALTEVKQARGHLGKQYAGAEHECLEWAQQFLENALNGKGKPK